MSFRETKDFEVLVIEQVAETAGVMELVIEQASESKVVQVETPEAGLAHLKKGSTDIVILDSAFPDEGSLHFCATVRSDPDFGHIPVILVAENRNRERMFDGLKAGAVDFLIKPLYASELIARVNTHVLLKRQKDLTAQKVVEQRELLQLMCHDISGPVSSVKMAIEMCERKPERFVETINPIKSTLDRILDLTDLVRQMRAFEDGKFEFSLQPWPLASLIEQAVEPVAHRYKAKNITVVTSIRRSLEVKVEAVSFVNSVIANLLSNAIKFSFEGAKIEVGATERKGRVFLLIEDHGVGMPTRLVEKLFDLNHPTSRPGTNQEPGTGFGMLLVKKFVEGYGGRILIDSRDIDTHPKNPGTQIILDLPSP